MVFLESITSPTGSKGSSAGPGFNTNFLDSKGGAQTRIGRWDGARRQFKVRIDARTPERAWPWYEMIIACEGGKNGFRHKDWNDYSTGAYGKDAPAFTDMVIGTGDGTTTQFQLIKLYAGGGAFRTRNLDKPVAGVLSGITGVGQKTEGTHFSVDYTTGTVTYATAPTLGQQVTAGCYFDCAGHFGPATDQLLDISFDEFLIRRIASLDILEELSPSLVNDEFHYGGSFALTFGIPTQITPLLGRTGALTPTASTDILVPAATLFDPGAPYFYLSNLSGSFTITVKSAGVTIGTIAAGATKTMGIFIIGGVNVWRLF